MSEIKPLYIFDLDGTLADCQHRTPNVRLAKVVAFLLGEASLEGVWFGEKHPSGQPYWWRNNLRGATRGPVNGR